MNTKCKTYLENANCTLTWSTLPVSMNLRCNSDSPLKSAPFSSLQDSPMKLVCSQLHVLSCFAKFSVQIPPFLHGSESHLIWQFRSTPSGTAKYQEDFGINYRGIYLDYFTKESYHETKLMFP